MPEIWAVPLPGVAVKFRPFGSVPLCFVTVTAGFGGVVVIVKVFCVPTVKQVLFALVNFGVGGGCGFGSVLVMLTGPTLEWALPLLALYWNESDGAAEPSFW